MGAIQARARSVCRRRGCTGTGRRPNCDLTANEGRPLEAGAPIFYLSSQTSSMRQPLKMLLAARVSPMT
jgi:hypothetical protein